MLYFNRLGLSVVLLIVCGFLSGCYTPNSNETEVNTLEEKTDIEVATDQVKKSKSKNIKEKQLALFNQSQIKDLMSINNLPIPLYKNAEFRVILPSYIPSGFLVDSLYVNVLKEDEHIIMYYTVTYRNSQNLCFIVNGYHGPSGDGPRETKKIEVISPALGKVIIEYTDFDRLNSPAYISMWGFLDEPPSHYYFESTNNTPNNDNCKPIKNLKEAIKIVESLDFVEF